MQTQEEKSSLKDHLFNPAKIEKIATEIKQVYNDFEKDKFIQTVLARTLSLTF